MPRKICPKCEAHGVGPCDECDRLNRKRVPVSKLAKKLAAKHSPARGTKEWDYIVFGFIRGHAAANRRNRK